jgi:uncharacterized protein (TIGR02246 family)
MADLLAQDGDFVNGRGLWIKGRQQFLELNVAAQRKQYKESIWKTDDVTVRWLAPDEAIVHVYWTLRGDLNESG